MIPGILRRLPLAGMAAVTLLCVSPALAQDPASDPAADIIQLAQPVWDPAARQLSIAGKADLPEGAVLKCSIFFGDVAGPHLPTQLQGKKFKFEFPPVDKNKQFLPGKYRFDVECPVQDQSTAVKRLLEGAPKLATSLEVVVGDAAEGDRIRAEVRKSYISLVEEMRQLYQVMENEASFDVGRIIAARTKAGGKVPVDVAKRITDLWEDFCKRHVDERLRTHRLDFEELRKGCYISPYPVVERDVESMLTLIQKWYGACWNEMAKLLDLEPPKGAAALNKREIMPMIERTAVSLYSQLGIEAEDWLLINPFRAEEGAISGNTYISKTSKFRIDCPEGWEFNTEVVHTTIRIRLLPKDEKKKTSVVVAVELMDYPECQDAKDLDTAIQLATADRWPGFKKIKGGSIKANDETMPGGVRAGFSLLALAIEKDLRYNVNEYSLYCRWFKRTYTVVTICKEEVWESIKDDVDKIGNSFRILDKPK